MALRFGANDMGSIMIEENVVSAAGANNRADEQMLRYLIREAGFIPQQRDILYKHVRNRQSTDHADLSFCVSSVILCNLWILSYSEIELLLVNRRIARDVDWAEIVFDLDHHVAFARA